MCYLVKDLLKRLKILKNTVLNNQKILIKYETIV